VFAFGLFPDEPLRKTELAAKQYQQRVREERSGGKLALRSDVKAPFVSQAASAAAPRAGSESAR
jgi:hypothetical protein